MVIGNKLTASTNTKGDRLSVGRADSSQPQIVASANDHGAHEHYAASWVFAPIVLRFGQCASDQNSIFINGNAAFWNSDDDTTTHYVFRITTQQKSPIALSLKSFIDHQKALGNDWRTTEYHLVPVEEVALEPPQADLLLAVISTVPFLPSACYGFSGGQVLEKLLQGVPPTIDQDDPSPDFIRIG